MIDLSEYTVVTKAFASFIVIMIVGVLIVAFSNTSKEEQTQQALLRSTVKLGQYANSKCIDEIKSRTGERVYATTNKKSDNLNFVELTWDKNAGKNKTIVCRYVKGEGIESLIIDGVEQISNAK